jgi:hypothetical protein
MRDLALDHAVIGLLPNKLNCSREVLDAVSHAGLQKKGVGTSWSAQTKTSQDTTKDRSPIRTE